MKNKGTWIIVGIVAAFVLLITDSRNFCKYQQQSGFVGGTGLYG